MLDETASSTTPVQSSPVFDVEDPGQGTHEYLWNQHPRLYLSTVIGSVVASLGIALYLFVTDPLFLHTSADNDPALYLPVLPLLAPIILYLYVQSKMRRMMMQQLSASLGFQFEASSPLSTISGVLFSQGRSRNIRDVMTGVYGKYPLRFFTYSYTVGSGKSSRTYSRTVLELTYPIALPHVLLWHESLLFFKEDLEKVELESEDFNKLFHLYVQKGKEIEIREIFQPDVMQKMIDRFSAYSFEIKDSNIYIANTWLLNSKKDYLEFLNVAETLFVDIFPGLQTAASA